MTNTIKHRILALTIAFVLAFSFISLLKTDKIYAASNNKKPAKVSSLKWSKIGSNTGKLTWKIVKNAKKYEIYYGYDYDGDIVWKKEKTVKTNSYKFRQPQAVTRYYKVRAINGNKKGKFSSKRKVKLPVTNYNNYNIPDFGAMFDCNGQTTTGEDGARLYLYYFDMDEESAFALADYYADYLKANGWLCDYDVDSYTYGCSKDSYLLFFNNKMPFKGTPCIIFSLYNF